MNVENFFKSKKEYESDIISPVMNVKGSGSSSWVFPLFISSTIRNTLGPNSTLWLFKSYMAGTDWTTGGKSNFLPCSNKIYVLPSKVSRLSIEIKWTLPSKFFFWQCFYNFLWMFTIVAIV